MPGVPHEMYDMMHRAVLPDLVARSGEHAVIASRVLRTWGESESGLNERLDDVIDRLEAPGHADAGVPGQRLGGLEGPPHRQGGDPSTTASPSSTSGRRSFAARIGPLVFGVDDDTMESVVLESVPARGLTLATAESVTGGLVGGPPDRHRRRERRVPRFDRELRDRCEAIAARRQRGPGGQRIGGTGDGARCSARCSAPTSACR